MGLIEILMIVAAVALVVFTVVYNLIKKVKLKKKGGGCGCGCAGCTKSCPYAAQEEKHDKEI